MDLKTAEYCGGWIATYDDDNLVNCVVSIYKIEVEFENGMEPLTLYVRCEADNWINGINENLHFIGLAEPNLEIVHSVELDNKTYKILGTEKLSDLYEEEYYTIVFDSKGEIQSFQ